MATYLLDTNICIYIAKRHPPEVLKQFERLKVGDIAMSLITYGELLYGAEKSCSSAKALKNIQLLSELIEVLPLSIETAFHYGEIRADLTKSGMPIGANDLWIAAHARAENLIVVTNNQREFDRVRGLVVENWVDGN